MEKTWRYVCTMMTHPKENTRRPWRQVRLSLAAGSVLMILLPLTIGLNASKHFSQKPEKEMTARMLKNLKMDLSRRKAHSSLFHWQNRLKNVNNLYRYPSEWDFPFAEASSPFQSILLHFPVSSKSYDLCLDSCLRKCCSCRCYLTCLRIRCLSQEGRIYIRTRSHKSSAAILHHQ